MPSFPSLSSDSAGRRPTSAAANRGYTTRVLKGAALVSYSKELLRDWDEEMSLDQNLELYHHSGSFGRASRGRAGEILRVLRERYLNDEDVRKALSILCRARPEAPTIEHVFAYHAALTDPLLFDFAADFLWRRHRTSLRTVTVPDAVEFLTERGVLEGSRPWSTSTTEEVSRKLLTAFRDFGFLRGAVKKALTTALSPPFAVAWVATHRMKLGSPGRLVEDPAFRVLLLTPEETENQLRAADRLGLVRVQGAGLVARIDPRHGSLEELARAL